MIEREVFLENLEKLRQRIITASKACGRNFRDVSLLPVTKNWPVEAVSYCMDAGIRSVGENRVQEALLKQDLVKGMAWELIGHLQTNKVKQVIGRFNRIQTVDSRKLLSKLQGAAAAKEVLLDILIQVNSGNDPAKHGFSLEDAVAGLDFALTCSNLRVQGLMTIAPYAPEDPDVARSCFERLENLRTELEVRGGLKLPELSMGMSADLEEAIASGSTMIRVGSALFGDRAGF